MSKKVFVWNPHLMPYFMTSNYCLLQALLSHKCTGKERGKVKCTLEVPRSNLFATPAVAVWVWVGVSSPERRKYVRLCV